MIMDLERGTQKMKKLTRYEMETNVAEMVADFIKDCLDDNKKKQILKALEINEHLTSTYALQVREVQDIHGRDSRTSGWYVIMEGTRCGVNFFINNEFEIVRKPRNVEVKYAYNLYNHYMFSESFWLKVVENW